MLQGGVQRVHSGDFNHPIRLESRDELEELANEFNEMTARLSAIYADLARQVNERSRQLVRSERMVSVGFLAAGVAHEINNPLASIAFCAEAMERRLQDLLSSAKGADAEAVIKYLKVVQQEAFRCKQITQKLLEFGRKTFEIFAGYWPYQDENAPYGGIAKLFNAIRKYTVSRSGDVDTTWEGSVLLRDIAEVRRLKQQDGPNLVTQGSTELVHALLANDLVDAMSIFTVPIVLGGGKKLFADGSAPHSFKLVRSRVSPNGLIIGHYDSPSELEIARRKRMKREG